MVGAEDKVAEAKLPSQTSVSSAPAVLVGLIIVITTVPPQSATVVEEVTFASLVGMATDSVAETGLTAGAGEALLPPKEKDCVASFTAQGAWSSTLLEVMAKQVPAAFMGAREKEVVFARGKSWEFVTRPPVGVSF